MPQCLKLSVIFHSSLLSFYWPHTCMCLVIIRHMWPLPSLHQAKLPSCIFHLHFFLLLIFIAFIHFTPNSYHFTTYLYESAHVYIIHCVLSHIFVYCYLCISSFRFARRAPHQRKLVSQELHRAPSHWSGFRGVSVRLPRELECWSRRRPPSGRFEGTGPWLRFAWSTASRFLR